MCRIRGIVKQLEAPEANTSHRTMFSTSNFHSLLQVATTTTTNIPFGNTYKSREECARATMRFHLERNEIAKKMCQMAKVNRWNGCSRCEFRRTFVLLSENLTRHLTCTMDPCCNKRHQRILSNTFPMLLNRMYLNCFRRFTVSALSHFSSLTHTRYHRKLHTAQEIMYQFYLHFCSCKC